MGAVADHRDEGPFLIRVLPERIARKIAAGEVIDRPFSVVRELIDNALDAKARSIDVYLETGGLAGIRVVDDGVGMGRSDLEVCWRAHATSKIETEDDLYSIRTLGFRGEALSAISAVSRLTITSNDGTESHRLAVDAGASRGVAAAAAKPGTVAEVRDLFFNLPGRKRFLRHAAAESALCRAAFEEKALPFPEVAFRLFVDGRIRLHFPAAALVQRVLAVHQTELAAALVDSVEFSGDGFSGYIVYQSAVRARRDRRLVQVYINRRRIQEFSLVQAVEYGYRDHLPGGTHPACFLFVEVDPDEVDFNIHPAKKEARIRPLRELHHSISSALFAGLRRASLDRAAQSLKLSGPGFDFGASEDRLAAAEPTPADFIRATIRVVRGVRPPRPEVASGESSGGDARAQPIYLGRAFGLFLLAQWGEALYLIDQHAAHERLLFESLREPGPMQRLLVAIRLPATDSERDYLLSRREALDVAGVRLGPVEDGGLEVTSVAAALVDRAGELAEVLLETAAEGVEEVAREVYARMACRASVRDGDELDDQSARALVEAAFRLPEASCPHGRPIWARLDKDDLLKAVRRVV